MVPTMKKHQHVRLIYVIRKPKTVMKKKLTISVVFILMVSIIVGYKYRSQNNLKCMEDKKWALNNFGQKINGIKGKSGIDINLKNIENKKISNKEKITIGIVDTGMDVTSGNIGQQICVNHKEVINKCDDDKNGYVDDYYGWDFYNGDSSIYDNYLYDYHGTYIANLILDVAPNVKLISSKFLKGTKGEARDAIHAIEYAIDNGATIINCSWCFNRDEKELYNLMKKNEDIIFVCAAGNSNLDLDENEVFPASYQLDNVISVMAIDNQGKMYDLSGYGSHVTIAAPGKDIWVTLPENDQEFVDGTSASTAFVSATVALMKLSNSRLTPKEMKHILIDTASKIDVISDKCEAGGCLNVAQALEACR